MGLPLDCPLYPVSANTRARLTALANKLPDGMVGRLTDEETVLIGRGATATALELPSRTGIATMISNALSGFSGGPALASTAPAALAATAAAGTGTTAARADHVHALPAAATTAAAGLMSAADKAKLDGVSAFVTDAEKSAWDAKAAGDHTHEIYATIENAALLGMPTAPTAPANTNTNQLATCKYVNDMLTGAINNGDLGGSNNNVTLTPGATIMGGVVDGDGMGIVWTVPGVYTFVPPQGVTTISAVAVGGGGAAAIGTGLSAIGGGGGSLAWKNNIAVTSAGITITVGAGGTPGGGALAPGGASSVGTVMTAGGGASGSTGAGGVRVGGDGGGDGGYSQDANRGGGGAGGYAGNGGRGGNGASSSSFTIGSGGGGGGGGGGSISSGGGVGLYVQGANGSQGKPGSGGTGRQYGGGGNSYGGSNTPGGGGAVRIIWGDGRSYPLLSGVQ